MKKINLWVLCVAFILSGCEYFKSSTNQKIDYLPCRVDKGEDWGLVDKDGNVVCQDLFKNQPTPVQEGVFFVEENKSYSMYSLVDDKPQLMAEKLVSFGIPAEGLVPVCRKDSRIEIIGTDGEMRFQLDEIGQQEVVACGMKYNKGYLWIMVADKSGKELYGAVDHEGNVVLPPQYAWVGILDEDNFLVGVEKKGNVKYQFIDKERQTRKPGMDISSILSMSDQYIVTKQEGRCYIYDLSGEKVLKCPTKVKDVSSIKGNYFVYENEEGDKGVMDIEGNAVMFCKYEEINISDKGFIARRDYDHDVELYDLTGEKTGRSYEEVYHVEGFGDLAVENGYYLVLNQDFEPTSKTEFYQIKTGLDRGSYYSLQSEFFDYKMVAQAMKSEMEKIKKEMPLGTKLTAIKSIVEKGTGAFSSDSRTDELSLAAGSKYSIKAVLRFDDAILSPVYKKQQVERYDWYYGTYYDTETVFDGYKFNAEAGLNQVIIKCSVPEDKTSKMAEEIKTIMQSFGTPNKDGSYEKDGYVYHQEGTSIYVSAAKGLKQIRPKR